MNELRDVKLTAYSWTVVRATVY